MDLDSAILWYASRGSKTHDTLKKMGVHRKLLNGAAREAWDFIDEYREEHGDVPPHGVIENEFDVPVHAPVEDDEDGVFVAHTYVVNELFTRFQHRSLSYGIMRAHEALQEGEQAESVEEVLKLADHLRGAQTSQLQIHSLSDIAEDVLKFYDEIKSGVTGVPFPWQIMTDMTLGMWPGTLTFFVARPGVGKTWTAILIAMNAWASGKKVLIVSPELARVELGERMVAKYGKLPYKDMVSGTLPDIGAYPKLKKSVEELKANAKNLFILDNEEKLNPESIEQAIQLVEPDLVLFDSIYMLRVEQGKVRKGAGSKGDRMERLISTIDWMRVLSRRQWSFAPDGLPIVGIHQLSRDGKLRKDAARSLKQGNGTGGLEDAVALSDTLFWNAHNLFAMYQDDHMRRDKNLIYVPLKVRRQALSSSLVIRWDMENMDFQQLGTKITDDEDEYEGEDDDVPY